LDIFNPDSHQRFMQPHHKKMKENNGCRQELDSEGDSLSGTAVSQPVALNAQEPEEGIFNAL
jgi:hypothetical protein